MRQWLKPRLHLIHVSGYKLYSLVSLVAVYMYPVSATKLSLTRYYGDMYPPVSTCIWIQVARPGYLYPATCIWCKTRLNPLCTTHLSTLKGWKAELALLADPQRAVYPQTVTCTCYWSGAGQGKFAGQRPAFYHCATPPMLYWKSLFTIIMVASEKTNIT